MFDALILNIEYNERFIITYSNSRQIVKKQLTRTQLICEELDQGAEF